MVQVIAGAVLLSIVHALIPNHWLPFVAIGKAERWSMRETLIVAAIAGFAHITGTIIIGVLVGLLGIGISSSYQFVMKVGAPVILIVLGLIFIAMDIKGGHHHEHIDLENHKKRRGSKIAIIASLSSAMFLSPCIEIAAYYFTAANHGWTAIMGVSMIYLVVTLSGMLTLVYLGLISLKKLRWTFLEEHEKFVTGLVLVLLGGIAYFSDF
jgi:hypothetical protein